MSRRRSQSELSVSLFPFLAVLVCAMGALILLLLIITRQVRPQAMTPAPVAEAEAVVSHSLSPVLQPARIELAENYAPAMLPQKSNQQFPATDAIKFDEKKDGDQARMRLLDKQKEELQNSRLQQKLIQMQIADLTSRLADEKKKKQELKTRFISLSKRKDELKKNGSLKRPSSQNSNHLKQLQEELLRKKRELKEQKQVASDILGKLQIVTYDGATGIRRKPIFIECNAGNVTFQPEKVKLTAEDLERYSPDTHPLGFAVRALNEYRNQKEASQEPAYVLLIVRPNGIDEFYSTRRILGVQGIAFGYELVGQKQEFYFNQLDAQAKKVIEDSLTQSRQSARQKQRGGFHLTGNGHSPHATQRPENRNRTPGGIANNLLQRSGSFKPTERHSHGSPGQSPKRDFTGKMNRRGGSAEFKKTRPSNTRGLAKNGTRYSPSNQSPLERGKWDSAQSQRRNSSPSSSKQSASTANTPQDQLERMLSQGEGLGNPNIFPQLNSLSSRAKQLSRGTPDTLISFERQLSIKITPGSLQVGTQKPVSISELETEIETQRKFLNSLEQEMSKWPAPPRGFRWVPGFQLIVTPGSNQTAFRIEAVAKELKLRTETKFSMGSTNSNNPF